MTKGKKGFQPGNKYGIHSRFSKDKQPKRNGRKPSIYKRIDLPKGELSKEDFSNLMLTLMECSISQLDKIRAGCYDPKSKLPIWIASLITAIRSDIKHGKIDTFKWVLDHKH